MRINEVIEIAHGDLLNQPDISSFGNITAQLSQVLRGSLFIATTEKDAKEAIVLGAYGILFEDGELNICDEECAWIRVDSLQDAITRLIRHRLLTKNITMLYCNKIEFEIAEQISTDPRMEFLQGGYTDFLESIQKQGVQKIITHNTKLLDIALDYTQSSIPQTEPFKIISCTLFDSKIYFDAKRYTLTLPSIFLSYLASVITLFTHEGLSFSLENFESISYLKPIFITSKGLMCPYGQSGKVLLAEKNNELFKHYAHYIIENAKWAKIIFILPQNQEFQSNHPILYYQSQDEILPLIQSHSFNFALILGEDSHYLVQHLPKADEEMSLFDE